MNGDAEYFRRRAVEEKTAAMKSAHPNARQAHLRMASQYEHFANRLSLNDGALLGFDPTQS
jgi:hypothetical protein